MVTYTNQQGCKTTQFRKNAHQNECNQTCACTRATLDKMAQGLRIKDRAKNVIFDSAWISGVD